MSDLAGAYNEYQIIGFENPAELSKVVKRYLDDGWYLWGAPFISWREEDEEDWIYQAMVRG